MKLYELRNDQRQYFGLIPILKNWDKQSLSETITVYFEREKIVKILDYGYGYCEYDTEINTGDRKTLLPKTSRGKEQNLTIPKLLKIKGSGIMFSGSFQGGGINVYDNRRNCSFIHSHSQENNIKSYSDIEAWITNYKTSLPDNYFEWLDNQLSQKRQKIKTKKGDIIAFKISSNEYGFARVLLDIFTGVKLNDTFRKKLYWAHPRSIIIAPYAFYSDSLDIDIDNLVRLKTLPTICIFDLGVYRGEFPIVSNRSLTFSETQIPFPKESGTFLTIPLTKKDIETFITLNKETMG